MIRVTAYEDCRGGLHKSANDCHTANWKYKKEEAVSKLEKALENMMSYYNVKKLPVNSPSEKLIRFIKDNPLQFRKILDEYIQDSGTTQSNER